MLRENVLLWERQRLNYVLVIVILLSFLFTVASPTLSTALNVPPLRGRVNDLAGMLPSDRAQLLEERLATFERETGHQIAVLTIPSLEGAVLEDFSIRVADAWKIGQKGFDNGVILLIARDDRKVRIEVGYGLEGVLPDAIASRIIREVIVPQFRAGDYGGGIEAGVDAIMKITQGEKLPDARDRNSSSNSSNLGSVFLILALFLPVFISQLTSPRSRKDGMRLGGMIGFGIGGTASALSWLLGSQVSSPVILGVFVFAVITGALGGLLGHFAAAKTLGTSTRWREPFYSDLNDYRRGRWGGFAGGGPGGGGSSGSGSFSGGGGSFGGGGASGGW